MKKLLLCVDGSDHSRNCTRYAAWVAKRTGAHISALYVSDLRQFEIPLMADLGGSLGLQPYQDVLANLQELEKKKAEYLCDATSSLLSEMGVTNVNFNSRTGLLVDTIEEFEEDADIVMIGKRGETADSATEHLGSNMERVIRASSKPCLVTSRAYREINKCVIAYDGGPSCKKALKWLNESKLCRGLEMHIVVVDESNKPEHTSRLLREAEETLKQGGYRPICQALTGTPEDALSLYIEQQSIDLLIMGAYGRSRIHQLFVGSTTTEMIRCCHVSVLCFR